MSSSVPYKSTAYQSKAGAPVDSATRDYREQCEQLRKELERKEQRNEKMTKEMQSIRSSYADLQREMRLTVSTIDKIKSEGKQFEEQANDLKAKNQVLTRKLQTANDPSELLNQINKDRKDQLFLNDNIVNLRGELGLRENKIVALQHELVIAHQALGAQSKYEHLMQPNATNNREVMRTLYFDMGKKQADLHAVTLALADVSQKLERTETVLTQTTQIKELLYVENEKLKGNLEHLNNQTVEYSDEIEGLRAELDRGDKLCEHLQQRVEDCSAELQAATAQHTHEAHERQLQIDSLSSDVAILQQGKDSLLTRLEHAHAAAVTNAEINHVREAELADQISRVQAKNAELVEKVQHCRALEETVDRLQSQLAEVEDLNSLQEQRISELLRLLSNKEQEATQASTSVLSLEAHLSALHVELSKSRDQHVQAAAERDEALDALRQTMRATRDLSQRLHQERALRENVERTNEQLLQAKANLSAATLDALYQERRKSAALEKSLALVPLVLKWRSACLPPADAVDRAVGAYARSFSSSSAEGASSDSVAGSVVGAQTQQAAHDVNSVAHSISGIASQLDTSGALHEGVNATFDWLLGDGGALPPLDIDTVPCTAAAEEKSGDADAVRASPTSLPTQSTGASEQAGPSDGPVSMSLPVPPQQQQQLQDPSSPEKSTASRVSFAPSPLRSPGIAAAIAEAYKHLEVPQTQPAVDTSVASAHAATVGSPNSMMGELRRYVCNHLIYCCNSLPQLLY
jgi:chromosome segregation ATPase